ncbi:MULTISPECIES: DUF421 domain-containing protein [Psychrobacter]|uniref:DUF421 domain-containing protein n=1 Tax=Psychrobacter TaxID=497 RepID=UPI00146CA29C|nr:MULTISPECIES: YetF domain-containing protein [Psychrobacter]
MDWFDIFIYDTTWEFAAEIVIRTIIMYSMVFLFLRFTGKRGIRQLSIFELVIIVSLGSIAGDPMFTEDLPLIQALLIMSLVIGLYHLCTWLTMRFKPIEHLLEGEPTYIVKNGVLVLSEVSGGTMSNDDFFAEMRQQGIRHLGQVEVGLLETDGEFSILLFEDDEVCFGLPIFPHEYQKVTRIHPDQHYACMHCGHIEKIASIHALCPRCKKAAGWAKALDNKIVD